MSEILDYNESGFLVSPTRDKLRFNAMDVAKIRKRTGLTQRKFSEAFHIPLPTLRKWEQGQRVPQGPTSVLLHVIDRNPKAVLDTLKD